MSKRLPLGLAYVALCLILSASAFAQTDRPEPIIPDLSTLEATRGADLNSFQQAALVAMRQSPPAGVRAEPYEVPNKFKQEQRTQTQNGLTTASAFQSFAGVGTTNILQSFDGASNADNGDILGFRVAPPDTDGDVGPDHYVQMVNLITTIFDKSGNILAGPVPGNIFWSGFGGDCEFENSGDPIVLYDENADRWVISQFALNFGTGEWAQCLAISTDGDPLGSYFRYAVDFTPVGINDYPKLGISSDDIAYKANIFNGETFAFEGVFAAAFEKDAMYAGDPLPQLFGGFLGDFGHTAGDLDGPDPGDVPAYFITSTGFPGFLDFWWIDTDYAAGTAELFSLFLGGIDAQDTFFCGASRGACIPQPEDGNDLESLAGRNMPRAQLRDMGTHMSMVVSTTVNAGSSGFAGVAWYEARDDGTGWAVYQEGVYAPEDGLHRWMPSIAMNAAGDIGVGYLVSSDEQYMSVGVAGQPASDSGSGMLGEESYCVLGGGVQTGTGRSGDYSGLAVDPVTDSFWHTNEYVKEGGFFVWDTRVCEFTVDDEVAGETVHIDDISIEKVGDDKDSQAKATIIVVDENGNPVEGAVIEFYFGESYGGVVTGVTDSDGMVMVLSEETSKGDADEFCVLSVSSEELEYVEGDNVDPEWSCKVYADRLGVSIKNPKKDDQIGKAVVTVRNSVGELVEGATVHGNFGGDFDEHVEGVTNAKGKVTFFTSDTAPADANVTFCVSNIEADLRYDASCNTDGASCDDPVEERIANANVASFDSQDVPFELSIDQNYPNPFNPTTVIPFNLTKESNVSIRVYNSIGQLVATLADGPHAAGEHTVRFDAQNLNAGLYLYTIQAGDQKISRRMTLLK